MEREGWKIVGDGKGMKVISGGGKKRGEIMGRRGEDGEFEVEDERKGKEGEVISTWRSVLLFRKGRGG